MIWSNAENATVRLAVDDEDPNVKYPNFTDEIGEKPNLTRIFLPKRHQFAHSGRIQWFLILQRVMMMRRASWTPDYVMVGMDGAGSDMKLSSALEKMFSCFTIVYLFSKINTGMGGFGKCLVPNDLFGLCSSEELTLWANPKHFYFNLGAIRFENLVVTLRVLSHYAPGLCIRRLNFGPHKICRGKDMRSTVMGWLHHRTIDDFKLIDILNEINCKCVVDIEVTLIELVKEGMIVEKEPDVYMIERKQLPQRNNDFVIEYLKYEGRKDDGNVQYNYKAVEGIDLYGGHTFCGQLVFLFTEGDSPHNECLLLLLQHLQPPLLFPYVFSDSTNAFFCNCCRNGATEK
ncbi:uncharacterized protein LOC133857581 [Alnus glutinosa]|uniref:uncharacterized protein LOC133857581 n=1 Tax=Alnus glutinosa TaxID=3517 RepID=UPI002D78107A|nr:uncharacterized protein LOC133857581 [Alnus glutinosa]XP_062148832.1 uncharacterized protein LOC133857581 [Alnus glutinosa]XP_062148833.1 uncharacterized protein LOC133857581 [Alnus glutinosa]